MCVFYEDNDDTWVVLCVCLLCEYHMMQCVCSVCTVWGGIACWLERRTHDWNVASLNPGRSGGRIFFSIVNFVCWPLFSVRSTPMSLQWQIKDSGHSAKSAGGRLHLNMHTPLMQWSQSGLTLPLSRHSVGTNLETSSHAAHQGTLGHNRLSSLSHCGLILAKNVELECVS